MILKLVEPGEWRGAARQILLDECVDEFCRELKRGRYVDEIVILPGGEALIVECADWPRARDALQVIETLRRLISIGKRVVAVIVVAGVGFDKRDRGAMVAALRSECSKHRVELKLVRSGQVFKLRLQGSRYLIFEAKCK